MPVLVLAAGARAFGARPCTEQGATRTQHRSWLICVTLGKGPHFLEPQFPHLGPRGNDTMVPTSWGSGELSVVFSESANHTALHGDGLVMVIVGEKGSLLCGGGEGLSFVVSGWGLAQLYGGGGEDG